jgi:ribose transport system substrate-binding protein
VLLVDAASETAVNGVIEKACKAGIIVISFDSIANAPCNTQLKLDFKGYKASQAEAVFKMLNGKGNVIQVRGVKGSAPDNDMYNAQVSALQKHPDIKGVATVYGQATASVAQSAIANVLPSLPHVDAVLGQGGSDDVGIAQAFTQYGGAYVGHMPVIEGGVEPTSSGGGPMRTRKTDTRRSRWTRRRESAVRRCGSASRCSTARRRRK